MDRETILSKIEDHMPAILGSEDFAIFSVLIPLVEENNELAVLFETRSGTLRRQPGEVCFPGGRVDPQDDTAKHTAIRETIEELGINQSTITNVNPTDYFVSPFGMIIYPFVGFLECPEEIDPNPSEVEDVFTVPLSYFLETNPRVYQIDFHVQPEKGFPYELIPGGENYEWQTIKMDEIFYEYDDKVIWGLTAKIMSHFVRLIK